MNLYNYSNAYDHNQKGYGIINKAALAVTLLFVFLIPWGDSINDGLTALFGIASFGLIAFVLITEGAHKNFSLYHFFVILLLSWMLISLMWTPKIDYGVEVAKRYFQLMLLPFVFTLILTNKSRLNLSYQAFVLGNFIASSIIIYNFLNGIKSKYYNRFGLENFDPDSLGVMLALSLPAAIYLVTQYENRLLKAFNTLSIPLIAYAIFLTGTRTASMLLIISVAYWLFTYRKSSIRIKTSFFVLFFLSIIMVFSLAPKASIERAFSSGESITKGTLNYRTVIWGAAIEQWKQTPLTGAGLGSLGYILSKEHVNYTGAHNTYIEFLAEYGIIGLLIYLLLLMAILYQILRCPFSEKVFLLSVFFIITISQIVQHSHIQKETWLMLTMLAIHGRIYSELKNNH
jgi:O-antigen ligase